MGQRGRMLFQVGVVCGCLGVPWAACRYFVAGGCSLRRFDGCACRK